MVGKENSDGVLNTQSCNYMHFTPAKMNHERLIVILLQPQAAFFLLNAISLIEDTNVNKYIC